MAYTKSWLFLTGFALLTAVTVGCGSQPSGEKSQTPVAPVVGDVAANLAELDAADRALAEKQRVCPVSGDLLGSMGKPDKVSIQGQTVFLCCPGCEDKLKSDPDKYLAKLHASGAK